MSQAEDWTSLKKSIDEERASLSYLDSFERMLKRKAGGASVEAKFILTEESLKSNQTLYVSEIVFAGEIPWLIYIQPNSRDSTTFDIVVICKVTTVIYYHDWEVYASIKLLAPKPIAAVTKTQMFKKSADKFVLPQILSEQKLKSSLKNKQNEWEFKICIDLKKLSINTFAEALECMSMFEVLEFIPLIVGSNRIQVLREDCFTIQRNLFKEEIFRLSTPIEWHYFLKSYSEFHHQMVLKPAGMPVKLIQFMGFTDLLIPLIAADYSSGSVSTNTQDIIMKSVMQIFNEVPEKDVNGSSNPKILSSFTNYMKTLSSVLQKRRYAKESCIFNIVVEIIPTFEHQLYKQIMAKELLPDALQFCKQENLSQIYSWHPHLACRNHHIVSNALFLNNLPLELITNGYFKVMTKGFIKRYLTVLANNKLNPYFEQTSQNLTYNNIARLLKYHAEPDILNHWITWIKDHAHFEPLLMDLVPPKVSNELPFTDKCGCFEYDSGVYEDMPIYDTVYRGYYETVTSPLVDQIDGGTAKNNTKLISDVTRIKDKGNEHFKNKEYYGALELYDEALDMLSAHKVTNNNIDVNLLVTMVRNNRVTTNIELGENEDALIDSTLTLRELWYLEQECQKVKRLSDHLDGIMNRAEKCRYRRVKALANLKLWPHALKNVMVLIENGRNGMRKVALPLYYQCLIKYMKTSKNFQYPFLCISCTTTEEPLTFMELKRCQDCRYPYCSTVCQKKDWDVHKLYCHHLSRLRDKLN